MDPLTALELSFADNPDGLFAPSDPWTIEGYDALMQRGRNIVPKMKSRCAGLLEIDENYLS
jgi:hypothetical protein